MRNAESIRFALLLLVVASFPVSAVEKPDIKKCFKPDGTFSYFCVEKVMAWCRSRTNQQEQDNCFNEITAEQKAFQKVQERIINSGRWDKEPDSIMGLKFGQRLQEQIQRCDPSTYLKPGQPMCWKPLLGGTFDWPHEVWNTPAFGGSFYLLEWLDGVDTFEGFFVDFDSTDAPGYLDILKKRYGEPTSAKQQTLQTLGGAVVTSTHYFWPGKKVTVEFTERLRSDITKGAIRVMTKTYLDAQRAWEKTKRERAADKL